MQHGHLQYIDPSMKIKDNNHRLAVNSKENAVISKDEELKFTSFFGLLKIY